MEGDISPKKIFRSVSFSFGFFACALGVFSPLFVLAEAKDFSLSPLFHEVTFEASDTEKRVEVEVSNRTDRDAEFFLSAVDFGTLDESGGVAFLGGGGDFERRYGLASWMRLPTDRMILPAGATEVVPVVIENKESLSPGGHYGAVAFQMENASGDTLESSLVSVRSSFASLFFVKKSGGEVMNLEYRGVLRMDRDAFGVPEKIFLRFQNAGNAHLVPRGIVAVRDMWGRVVRRSVLNEESGRILPESFRTYTVPLKNMAPAFLPGTYTISVEYRYDGSDDVVAAPEKTVFPVLLLFLWGLGGGGIIMCVLWLFTLFRKGKCSKCPIS